MSRPHLVRPVEKRRPSIGMVASLAQLPQYLLDAMYEATCKDIMIVHPDDDDDPPCVQRSYKAKKPTPANGKYYLCMEVVRNTQVVLIFHHLGCRGIETPSWSKSGLRALWEAIWGKG